MITIEKMEDFFAARADGYDQHMLNEVAGCKEAYEKMAELVPDTTEKLLDLGCGTGLELQWILERLPRIRVLGIDLSMDMLNKLSDKFYGGYIKLICGDFFTLDLGNYRCDTAVSFQAMHHFSHEMKTKLYRKIYGYLKSGGVYIECDYTAKTQEEEDRFYAENARIRKKLNIPENALYHFDTPCTADNQIKMLLSAGFKSAENIFGMENTTIIIAKKESTI